MKKMLFIIEAPGKIEHFFKAAVRAFGHKDLEVWATGGLIAEMSNKGALDAQTLKIKKETLNAQGRIFAERLLRERNQQKELPFHRIYVCTDPDREGEHIAWQIYRVLAQYTENSNISRGYTLDITPEGLKNMTVTNHLNDGMLMSRMARRVVDRLIPELVSYKLALPTWQGVGRVQIGGLEVAKRLEERWMPLQIKGYWQHSDGSLFYVEQYSKDLFDKESWQHLVKLKHYNVESDVVSHNKILPPPIPHTYLSLVKRFEEVPTPALADAIQEAYMAGRIGYPRTNRLHWTPYLQRNIAAMTDKLHLSAFLRNDWHDPLPEISINEWNTAGHPAMHPTALTLTAPPKNYSSLAQMIEKEILAHSCATLMTPARIQERELSVYFQVNGTDRSLNFKQWNILEHGWLKAYERSGTDYPFPEIPSKNMLGQQLYYSEHIPLGQAFTQDMHVYHVGQPHNTMTLMQNLQRRELMSGYATLTYKGLNLHSQIKQNFPKLIDVDYAKTFEQTLFNIGKNPTIYTEAIKKLLLDLDIDIMGLLDGQTLHASDSISTSEEVILPFNSEGFTYEFN